MAVYVIGDIHGEHEALVRLMDRVSPQPDDVVIQLGDCINRGPDSYAVVEYWVNFDRCTRFVIGGNHEELMFEYLVEGSMGLYGYAGKPTIASYRRRGWTCRCGNPASIPESHLGFYSQTVPWSRPFLMTRQYLFTHSGYNFGREPSQQDTYTLRWGRVLGWEEGKPTVVRGHTPYPAVQIRRNLIELDTGCGLGGLLSCLCLQTGEVISERP